jgi:transposase
MMGYETRCKIRHLHRSEGLNFEQIAGALGICPETAAKYARAEKFEPRRAMGPRASKLDVFKPAIQRLLDRHPYSAMQIFQKLRAEGYEGGLSILKDYVRLVRPVRHRAFLTLAFEPGEAAQVDWGYAGMIQIGQTRRRLSFFLMVLCHSRMAYVEFTCGEAMEHFLTCHRNALEYFGGVPRALLIDNLKTGVLRHPVGEKATFHPRYLDFAAHYGFEPRACNVRKANEKGRVENGVGYVKKNFLAGLDIPPGLAAMNVAARQWLDGIANVRIHAQTRQTPLSLFGVEKPALGPLPPQGADTSVTRLARATNRCRVVLDTNRYSVPSLYASQRLTLKAFPDRLCLYHAGNLIATHPRSYERHRDFENPEHIKELLDQRRRARDAKWLLTFYSFTPQAEHYHQQLNARCLNARQHINKIVALADIYGTDKVARAIEDAIASQAFASQYIENILAQRERFTPQPGPLHLTRHSDLLEIQLPCADLSLYDNHANINPTTSTP